MARAGGLPAGTAAVPRDGPALAGFSQLSLDFSLPFKR